jgi:hypothetical protein
MTRTRLPAPGHRTVKAALDLLRPSLEQIGGWLPPSAGGPVSRDALNNYHNGRREMPPKARRAFARQIRRHAARLVAVAALLEGRAHSPGKTNR